MANEVASAFVAVRPDISGFGRALSAGIGAPISAGTAGMVGLGAAIGGSISKAMDFDKTMRTVGATLGVTGAEQKQLSALALKMGKDTAFSAAQASDAMLELAKGGLTSAQIQGGALQSTLTLAAAGGLEMGSAATYMSNALNTFGLEAKDAGAVAAALAGGANASTASVESLGQALSQVGPGAKNAGLSLQTTTAILAAFDNAGIKGSDAGTSLKTMLTRLVPQTDKAAGAMKDLGLKFTDANGQFLPMASIAEQLKQRLSGLSDEQRTSALATIFGSDATRAATVLMNLGADGVNKYTKATSDQAAAQRMANTQMEGASGAWEQFKGSVETIAITLGTKLLPFFTAVVKKATDVANVVLDNIGPAFDSVAKFLQPAIDTVRLFFGTLSGQGSDAEVPWMNSVIDAGARVSNIFTNVVLPAFNAVRSFIVTQVVPAFMGIVGAVQGFVTTAAPIVSSFVQGMMQRLAPLMPTVRAIFGTIGQIITGAMALIQAVIQRVTTVISWIWTNWGNGIMNFLASVWSGIIGIVGPALEGIRSIIATVTALIRGDWSGAWEGIKGIVAAIFNTIKGIVSGALGILGTLFLGAMTKIGDAVNNGLTAVVRFIVGGMTRFGDAVNTGITKVVTWFQELPGKILGAIAGLGAQLFDAGVNVVGGFIRGLISKAGEIIAVVRDKIVGVLPDFVKDFLGIHSPSRVFMKLGQQTAAGMAVGLEAGARDVQKAAGSLIPSLNASRYSVAVSGDAATNAEGRTLTASDRVFLERVLSEIRAEVSVGTLDSAMTGQVSRS